MIQIRQVLLARPCRHAFVTADAHYTVPAGRRSYNFRALDTTKQRSISAPSIQPATNAAQQHLLRHDECFGKGKLSNCSPVCQRHHRAPMPDSGCGGCRSIDRSKGCLISHHLSEGRGDVFMTAPLPTGITLAHPHNICYETHSGSHAEPAHPCHFVAHSNSFYRHFSCTWYVPLVMGQSPPCFRFPATLAKVDWSCVSCRCDKRCCRTPSLLFRVLVGDVRSECVLVLIVECRRKDLGRHCRRGLDRPNDLVGTPRSSAVFVYSSGVCDDPVAA